MKLIVDTKNITPVYKQIIDQITVAIINEELKEGAQLPSIRQIAKDLAINPNTVAKSFQGLEASQLIISAGRKGSFIHSNAIENIKEMNTAQLQQVLIDAINQCRDLGFENQKIKKVFNQLISGEKI